MENFLYAHGKWNLNLDFINNELVFSHKSLEDRSHTYDLPDLPVSINVCKDYIVFTFKDESYYEIKFETEFDLVIDHYDVRDKFISTIGCYNVQDYIF